MRQIYAPLALIVTLLALSSCIGQKVTVQEQIGAESKLIVTDDTLILDSPGYHIPDSLLHLVDRQ